MRLTLKPFGAVDASVLERLRASMRPFGEVDVAPSAKVPETGLDPRRKQVRASSLFAICLEEAGDRVLGIADVDLYEVGLNFVFGYSQPNGRVAVISLARLRDRDPALFLERVEKEAVHEIGHTLGLGHDEDDRRCVMHFSRNLADTDRKGREFCASCKARAEITLTRLGT